MQYALSSINTHQDDRESIAQAIEDEDDAVLGGYVNDGTIIHVHDNRDRRRFFCIYCLDALRIVRSQSDFFRHVTRNDCLGSDQYLGILNPRGDGA